jgi:ribose 5-phosphate isomerase B
MAPGLNMPRRLVTGVDIEALPPGSELVVPPDSILTDRAREIAAGRGVVIRAEPAQPASSAGTAQPAAGRVVALGADHGGFELKEILKRYLEDWGYKVKDLGTDSSKAVDYPDFALAVARAVAGGEAWRGIMVDSVGVGSAMAANKVRGIRAALCSDRAIARSSREHNDANVLTLGGRFLLPEEAREIVRVWLDAEFAGGRHQGRVDKITAIEKSRP